MRAEIIPGACFPNYELPDQDGVLRRLSELQGADPMALMLARGGYCPKEHAQHAWMAAMQGEVEVGYSQLVTISPDGVLASKEWRQRLGARWTFLSDERRVVQQNLEIREYTDPEHDPMVPYTIFLEPGLVIHSVFNGYWYWGRPTPEELRQEFRAISRKCRPDWDLFTSDLERRWSEGDRSRFFPYGGANRT